MEGEVRRGEHTRIGNGERGKKKRGERRKGKREQKGERGGKGGGDYTHLALSMTKTTSLMVMLVSAILVAIMI